MPTPLRVSTLLVADDFASTAGLYADLGFEPIATDDPSCVGFVAGSTGVIVVDRAFASRCWGEAVAGELGGRCIPYVHVADLDAVDIRTELVTDTHTWFGTHERVVRTPGGLLVLVEQDHPTRE